MSRSGCCKEIWIFCAIHQGCWTNTKCEGKTLMVKPNKSSYWSILKLEFLWTDVTTKRDVSTWHFFKNVAVLFLFFEKLFIICHALGYCNALGKPCLALTLVKLNVMVFFQSVFVNFFFVEFAQGWKLIFLAEQDNLVFRVSIAGLLIPHTLIDFLYKLLVITLFFRNVTLVWNFGSLDQNGELFMV